MDDLRPIDDRDNLEGTSERVTSGCELGLAWGRGWAGVADTHRQVCLQLILNLPPVVFVVVHLVIAHHVDVQQHPLGARGFEEVILGCGERPELG